jgi:FtsP/CotA-like multicopper oxidase with cupredoxin domain
MRIGRWLLVATAGAGLIVLFLLLRPGADEATDSRSTPTPTATVTGEPTETPEPTPTPTATLDAVEIEVEEGRVEGPARIRVAQGDRVAIEVKADVADQVHVHGYDILRDVAPDQEVVIRFRADIPGVFEIELEDAGLLLTMLEVGP